MLVATLLDSLARHSDQWKTKDQNTTKYIMVSTDLYLGWTSRALTQATMVKISRCRSIEGNISIKPDLARLFYVIYSDISSGIFKNYIWYYCRCFENIENLWKSRNFWEILEILDIYSFEIWHIPSNTRRSASAREPAVSAPPPRPPLPPQWLELWCEVMWIMMLLASMVRHVNRPPLPLPTTVRTHHPHSYRDHHVH